MTNSLPIVNILDTPFYVDWEKKQVTQVAQLDNVISFAEGPDGRMTFLIDKTTRKAAQDNSLHGLLDAGVIEIRLRNPPDTDLRAAKFHPESRADYDINNARQLLQRIIGPLKAGQGYRNRL